jgi:hypothetical protein
MVQEEVTRKHRRGNAMSDATAARPHVHFGEENGKASGQQLLMDDVLAMAPRVQGIPLGRRRIRRRPGWLPVPDGAVAFTQHVALQGFAPFGHAVDS